MTIRSLRRPGSVLLLGFLGITLAGCREYNDYDQREPMMEAMLQAIEASEQELAQARQELHALQLTVAPNTPLQGFAREFQIIVDAHQAMLEQHEEMAAELRDGEWYRPLNRAYGTVLVEQEILRHRYAELLATATAARDTMENPPRQLGFPIESSYYVAPPYYKRLMMANRPLEAGRFVDAQDSLTGAPTEEDAAAGPQAFPDTVPADTSLPEPVQE